MRDAERMRVINTIPVGRRPVSLAVDVHDQVFVTNSGDDTVSVINSRTNTVSATINVGSRPEGVATDPQFGVYVANSGAGTLSAIDRLNTVIATIQVGGPPPILGPPLVPPNAMGVAIDHFLSRAYVTHRMQNRMSIIPISGELPAVASDFIDIDGPVSIAVDPVDHRVYVTQPDFSAVSVIDPTTNGVIATIPVGQRPLGIAIDRGRHRVFVANSGFKTVSVINASTGAVAEIEVGPGPIGVAVNSQGDAYVTHPDNTLKVIDAVTASVSNTILVGSMPGGVAFEAHSNRVYVANNGDSTVSAVDLSDPNPRVAQ
jgi:YVTN family beta-propeller protein